MRQDFSLNLEFNNSVTLIGQQTQNSLVSYSIMEVIVTYIADFHVGARVSNSGPQAYPLTLSHPQLLCIFVTGITIKILTALKLLMQIRLASKIIYANKIIQKDTLNKLKYCP